MLLYLSVVLLPCALPASTTIDTTAAPMIIHLAKVSPESSKAKLWIVYKTPDDLVKLEKEGFKILKTKIKMVRDNQFWSDIFQSSLNMAMGYIILKGGANTQSTPQPVSFSAPEQHRFHQQY